MRVLATAARWTEVYSQAAVRIARVGAVAAVALAMLSLAGNVFTRNALGYSLFGAEELARFAFLWAIWLGVSLGVKRGRGDGDHLRRRRRAGLVAALGAHLLRGEPGGAAAVRVLALDRVRDRPVRDHGLLAARSSSPGSTRSSR